MWVDVNMLLSLSAKELLTTTRVVRKCLDLNRPVERDVIEECISVAQQAPTASNMQNWHFVVVTDPTKKAELAELFRKGWETYIKLPTAVNNMKFEDPKRNATQKRIVSSAQYLVEHLKDVPVHVIPCIAARTEGEPTVVQSAVWGQLLQQHGALC
jgi:nitroreductase